ncbi:MAG TPA: ribonuclease III, partial [Colwellia sp.]|nr:ribonuclease III [Colwellia sp.]
MKINPHNLARLTKKLGYEFNEPLLLVQALTHRSAKG